MYNEIFREFEIELIIRTALDEDIKTGDITTNNLIEENIIAGAYMYAKEDGIISGIKIAEKVFRILDKNLVWTRFVEDGEKVTKGKRIAEFNGTYRALLSGERTALNFLQRMSGIATETSKYVEIVKDTKTKILDTRKTVPGLRMLDKYAVKSGGGTNHRIGLYDMVLIKDNHIDLAGGITAAVENIRPKLNPGVKIEVETRNLAEVEEAVNCRVDIIMLDNMDNDTMKKAVDIIGGRILTEASGNVNLERLKSIAETGVDFISVGALTHSVKALDISMLIEKKN